MRKQVLRQTGLLLRGPTPPPRGVGMLCRQRGQEPWTGTLTVVCTERNRCSSRGLATLNDLDELWGQEALLGRQAAVPRVMRQETVNQHVNGGPASLYVRVQS